MTKKEFSYVVISSSGDKLEQIYGVYKDVEGACYGARSALTTLFPKHGDEAKIIRCEIISTEDAQKQFEDAWWKSEDTINDKEGVIHLDEGIMLGDRRTFKDKDYQKRLKDWVKLKLWDKEDYYSGGYSFNASELDLSKEEMEEVRKRNEEIIKRYGNRYRRKITGIRRQKV